MPRSSSPTAGAGQSDQAGGDDKVGYGRPPRHSRFKPGQSGNPRGRPKRRKKVETILHEALYREVTVTQDGRRRRITLIEAFVHRLVTGAAAGDPRQGDRLLKLLPLVQASLARDDEQAEGLAETPEQRQVLAELARMMGGSPDQVFLGFEGGSGGGPADGSAHDEEAGGEEGGA